MGVTLKWLISTAIFVKNSGTPSFSARDLRRTFKTLAGSMGIPLEMVEGTARMFLIYNLGIIYGRSGVVSHATRRPPASLHHPANPTTPLTYLYQEP